jgi:RNA polymerase sigma-70 factor (ECF subfamily)
MTISTPDTPEGVPASETAEVIEAAKRGDEVALAELYTAHFDRVYSYLRVALNDGAEAEETTQEIFMKVLRSIQRYDQGAESFGDWLLAIARRHVAARLRKRAVPTSKDGVSSPNGNGTAVDHDQTLRALRAASDEELLLLLERLPEAQRQAVVLGYVLDFGRRETARVLGRTEDATETLQAHALASLNRRLSVLGQEPGERQRHAMRRFRSRGGALQPVHSVTLRR